MHVISWKLRWQEVVFCSIVKVFRVQTSFYRNGAQGGKEGNCYCAFIWCKNNHKQLFLNEKMCLSSEHLCTCSTFGTHACDITYTGAWWRKINVESAVSPWTARENKDLLIYENCQLGLLHSRLLSAVCICVLLPVLGVKFLSFSVAGFSQMHWKWGICIKRITEQSFQDPAVYL